MKRVNCNLSDGRNLTIFYPTNGAIQYNVEWEGFRIGFVYPKESTTGSSDIIWAASTEILNCYIEEISAVIVSSFNEH